MTSVTKQELREYLQRVELQFDIAEQKTLYKLQEVINERVNHAQYRNKKAPIE